MPGIMSEGSVGDSAPGVPIAADPKHLGAEIGFLGVLRTQRLRGSLEQDVVDRGLVLECDGGDRLGYGEHHVEVRHVEQFRMAVRKPLRTGETLALRTVPIAAGNGKFPLAALWANPVMGSRRPA